MTDKIQCPECKSEQIHAERRGWSLIWGVAGMNRIVLTCLKCGHKFRPGNAPGPIEGLFKDSIEDSRRSGGETVEDRIKRANRRGSPND